MQSKKAKSPADLPYNPFSVGLVQAKPPRPKRIVLNKNTILDEVVEEKGVVPLRQIEPQDPVESLTVDDLEDIFGPMDCENKQQQYQEEEEKEQSNRLVRVYEEHDEEDELLRLLEETSFQQVVPLSNQGECIEKYHMSHYIQVLSRLKKRVDGSWEKNEGFDNPTHMTKEEIELLFQWSLDMLTKKAEDEDKFRSMNLQMDKMFAQCEVTYPFSDEEEDQIRSPLENVDEREIFSPESVENTPEPEQESRSLLDESILHINESMREDVGEKEEEKEKDTQSPVVEEEELILGRNRKRRKKRKSKTVTYLVWDKNNNKERKYKEEKEKIKDI